MGERQEFVLIIAAAFFQERVQISVVACAVSAFQPVFQCLKTDGHFFFFVTKQEIGRILFFKNRNYFIPVH